MTGGGAAVQVLKGIAQLQAPAHHIVLGLRAIGRKHARKRTALHIIHDYVQGAVFIYQINDARNGRVIEALDHIRLGHDASHNQLALLGVGHILDFLGRPLLVEHGVERKIHRGHAANADLCEQLIAFADDGQFTPHRLFPPKNTLPM